MLGQLRFADNKAGGISRQRPPVTERLVSKVNMIRLLTISARQASFFLYFPPTVPPYGVPDSEHNAKGKAE